MMMRSALSSGLFFFLSPVLLLLLVIPAINATQDWFKSVCINQTGYYTTNSTYQTNLHGLLSSLTSYNITTYAFYSWSFGENPDEVYATGLCRGDLKPDECKSCLNDSESLLTQRCPKHKAAIGWSPSCTLRYSNHQLFGIMQIEPAFSYQSLQSVLSDLDSFSQGLKALLGNLTIRALGGEGFFSNFAEGSFKVSATDNIGVIYGMVQCSPDLTASDCEYCISHGLEIIDDYCYGKTYAFVGLPSCNVAYNLTPFYDLSVDVLMHLSPQQTPHQLSFPAVSLSAPPPTEDKGKSKNASRTVTIVVVSTLIAFLLFLLCIWRENFESNMRLRNIRGTPGESHIIQTGDRLRATPRFPEEHDTSELPIFHFSSILVATDNFSIKNKLGQGGFGPVYKGRLQDGTEVAVKRLSSSSGQGMEEFKNEMILISKLQHRNLVRLIGCCVENEEKLLIYEFMPNKSLDNFIFDPRSRAQFNWTTRFNVIKGVAKGLLYLHRDSRLRIIHRDLKVSNILLDEKMNPKISDFGLARIFQGTLELADTRRIVGTLGYMSPEYALGGIFSEKSDVFSFGILILEIVSGRKNTSFHYCDQHLNLIAYAWDLWSESRGLDIVDKALEDSYSSTEAMRCIHIGLLCIQDNAIDRPTMPDVVFMLCSETDRPQPKQPLFTCQRSSSVELQQQNDSNCSANKFTMSTVEGR